MVEEIKFARIEEVVSGKYAISSKKKEFLTCLKELEVLMNMLIMKVQLL